MGRALLSKSLIQFSVDGLGCVPSQLFTWGQTMVEVMKIMVTPSKDPMHALLHSVPPTCSRPPPTHTSPETPGHLGASLGQYLVRSLPLSPGSWCTQGFVCALQESVSPVLCKFWGLHVGINCDLLQEVFCHTQVCCTQSPCPCGSPLLTHTSTGDAQTQFCLSVCGVPGSWCTCLSLLSISGRNGV